MNKDKKNTVSLNNKIDIFLGLATEARVIPELWTATKGMCAKGLEFFRVLCHKPSNLEFVSHQRSCPECQTSFICYLDTMIQLYEEGE